MKTHSMNAKVPEAFDERIGEPLIHIPLTAPRANADGLRDPIKLRVQDTLED